MSSTSIPLLLAAAGTLGFLHSILPDHWVPLAVVARTQRWTILHTARISLLASAGHVLTSIGIAAIIAAVGLQFRATFETQQAHIVGAILILTGIGFLVWDILGGGYGHSHGGHGHTHDHDEAHASSGEDDHEHEHPAPESVTHGGEQRSVARQLAAIAVPFGAAASPDLTVLPVALAASTIGVGAVVGVLVSFSAVTLATFAVATVAATLAGYQVKGEWLEEHGNTITAGVLVVIGAAVFLKLF